MYLWTSYVTLFMTTDRRLLINGLSFFSHMICYVLPLLLLHLL